jgi:hypothetical protein
MIPFSVKRPAPVVEANGSCYWKQGKRFFFEKKEAKDFVMLSRAASASNP